MINHVSLNGVLCAKEEGTIYRLIKVIRNYKDQNGVFINDYIPCVMWTRNDKNELFSYKEGTFVSIDGRIECENERMIVVIEQLTFICNNLITYRTERT